jgi:uncharacterized repeat protein (TIGR04052 family)
MMPIKQRMKITYYTMKLTYTLPFRPDISNFLCRDRLRKVMAFFLFVGFIQLNSSCSKINDKTGIEVEIWHNGSPLDCNAFEDNQQVWSIQQLAFFISNVKLSSENSEHQTKLSSTPWQTDDVVLIKPYMAECGAQLNKVENASGKIENKTESKTDSNTEGVENKNNMLSPDNVAPGALKTNNYLQFVTPVDFNSLKQFSFTLAVPFELNHQNPLLQPSPLNLPSMFWSWRSGHKFFRLDVQSPYKNWVFHLGSVGCTAASTMRSPQSECVQPNRLRFDLDKIHDGTKLVMHLDRLIANISIQNNDSCLFNTGQESCAGLMSNFKTQDVFEWH